jgi:arylsulfatase A-like enzyme
MRRRAVALASLLTAVAWSSGCHGAPPNVLVIVVDALRADHLAAYGYARETSPTITRLAAQGVRFANAYAQGPSTVPTHSSLFSGRLPFQHGSYDARYPLRDEELTLAEFFAGHGYRTFAVASSVRFHPLSGYAQGFETYDVARAPKKSRLGAMVTQKALRIIQEHDERPFFGFLHYLGPHQPYAPPEPYRSQWHPGRAEPRPEETGTFLSAHADPERPLDPETLAYLIGLYDGEISALDPEIGRLLGGLVLWGYDRNTIVVLTADHGEQFKEHGGLSHGGGLYEELLRVPLIVRWPARIAAGRVVSRPTQTVDLFPTLAALAGVPPPEGLPGRNLAPALLGAQAGDEEAAEDPILAQGSPRSWALLATIGGRRFKYERREHGAPLLFDLTSDPGGSHDVLAGTPAVAARLADIARGLGVTAHDDTPAARGHDVPTEVREQLRALGYAEEADRPPLDAR